MDKYEYQVIVHRIQEIGQEQLSCLDYICDRIDYIVDEQRENVRGKMMKLLEEKFKLLEYLK